MHIRNATEEDLPAIVAIYNQAVLELATADIGPIAVADRIAWFRAHSPERRPVWVAEDGQGGPVIGWVSFQDFYERPSYVATAELSIYVAKERRRQGVGRILLEEAIVRCPGLGVKNLIGLVFAHNKASLGLVASAGFQRWGYLPRVTDLSGAERDVVVVGLRVGPDGRPERSSHDLISLSDES